MCIVQLVGAMSQDNLKLYVIITQVASVIGCFLGMGAFLPLCSVFGISSDYQFSGLEFIGVLASLITLTVSGYYITSYFVAYIMVLLKLINKDQISELGIGGIKS